MALSGLEIFKKLPKTNCKDCGFPTCLAFAMQLAAGKVELEKCPHVSDEIKELINQRASSDTIIKLGKKQGLTLLKENAILKMLKGITTYTEVLRCICGES